MWMSTERRTRFILSGVALVAAVLANGVVFASGGGEGHGITAAVWKDFGWRVLNFAVLAGILIWAVKKANVKGSLEERQVQIEKNLTEARIARESAEAKLKEYSEKLSRANQEIDDMRAAMMKEADVEKVRIVEEAKLAADKILVQAAQAADQEVLKARSELRIEAARLAVELAGNKLAGLVQKADHDRFVQDYLGKVV